MSKSIICEEHIDEITHDIGIKLDQHGAIVDVETLCDINDVITSVLIGTCDAPEISVGVLEGNEDKIIDDLCYGASNILKKYNIELSQEKMELLNDVLAIALVKSKEK